MFIFPYKQLTFLFLLIVFAFAAKAQQDHFIYLQTDNGKPFYVRMNNKIVSSSSEGYIIIPNVQNGVYNLQVGFPKREYPEENFTVSVESINKGFLIKHFEDKGLQLFNMETLALISANKDEDTTLRAVVTTQDNNPFTKMLANVVQDSSILQNHELKQKNSFALPDTLETNNQISSNDNLLSRDSVANPANTDSSSMIEANNTVSANADFANSNENTIVSDTNSIISKILSKKDDNGLQMVYSDRNGENKDTVRVFMPSAGEKASSGSETTNNHNFDSRSNANNTNPSSDTSQLTITPTIVETESEKKTFVLREDSLSKLSDSANIKKAKTAPEQVFYIGPKEKNDNAKTEKSEEEEKGLFSGLTSSKNSNKEADKSEKKAVNKLEVLPKVVTSSAVNSDCKEFADNQDFLRLRKKMASENNKESMIKMAKKSFRSKCFSTAQIKDLSFLFLTDEGKYMFFDAAYPHASDSDQYSSLEEQLKDSYYRSRFEAMIKH